jgi:class 3 adenylate cyclase
VPEHSERKLATVLFADLVDSTAAAGAQDPERTRARLERFYDAMSAEIEGAGGTIEKFAGDAVMAAFGAPEALEDLAGNDDRLIAKADVRALRLDWHAGQTEALLRLRAAFG